MSTDKPHLIRIDNQELRTLDRKLVIGRHPGCEYVLTLNDRNIGISGRHASIEAEGDIAWLEDLGSTNGTWVQGERVAKRTRLASGDRFQLDRLEFEFRAAVVKPAPAPAPPASAPQPAPRAPTTISVALEDLALPAPAPLKPQPVRTSPPRPEPVAAPPPPRPAPPSPPPPPKPPEPVQPPAIIAAPAVVARPAEPPAVPKTVEVQVLEEKAPPPPPKLEPVAAPPPPAPARSESPKPPSTDNKPQKVAGAWISADHSGKTKVLMPAERARLREQMGSGLDGAQETVSVPTLLFAAPEERRVTLAQRDSATQAWTIGSNADADVSIPSDGLSGLHAKILRNGQTWTISDLMSANGTFVNGAKINISHLESGNQLGFGPVLCTFLLPPGAMAPVAPNPDSAGKPARRPVALPLPLLLGGALLGLALVGIVIYLLLRH